MTKPLLALLLLAWMLGSMAGQEATITAFDTTHTVKIADCDEKIGVGGKITTLRELGYCHLTMPDIPPAGALLRMGTTHTVGVPSCDEFITFGGSSKAIRDIFPSECTPLKDAKPVIKMCSGLTGECEVSPTKHSLSDIGRIHEAPLDNTKTPDGLGHDCGSYPCDPPQDIPAIKMKASLEPSYRDCRLNESSTEGHMCFDLVPVRAWTCDPPTRILQHDEQTPPKWYCHKPQTENP